MRRTPPFLTAGLAVCLALVAAGCGPEDNAILLELRAQQEVDEIRIAVTSIEGIGPPRVITREVTDSSQIRIAVILEGPALVTVHVTGTTPGGETLVATRCYNVEGTIEDRAILAGPIAAIDLDNDGFVSDASQVCFEPEGETGERPCRDGDVHLCDNNRAQDCDDMNRAVFPGATVICQNGEDEDCDGEDEMCADNDGDGSTACPPGQTTLCDCDDTNAMVNPGAEEGLDQCNDGIDQNCDGFDACCDADGDGTPLCQTCQDRMGVPPELITMPPTACIDDSSCSPRDPMTGQVTMVIAGSCQAVGPDCDDNDPNVSPSATEVCDGVDNNCNGLLDELDECRGPDLDGDGAPLCGHPMADPGLECEMRPFECDAGLAPLNRERCGDGLDEDLDGSVDEGCPAGDADSDGQVMPQDCADDDALAYDRNGFPGFTVPDIDICGDGFPQNCMAGGDRPCSEDMDGDGFVEVVPAYCEGAAGQNPTVSEICDGIDNDCDMIVDEVLDPMMRTGCADATAIDFFSDDFVNCGGCRVACTPTTDADRCVMGECDCAGEPGTGGCIEVLTARLPSAPADPICSEMFGCIDLATDPNHCGRLQRACGAQETCVAGQCQCGAMMGPDASMSTIDQAPACGTTTDPLECCGGTGPSGTCVDTSEDEQNCGSCGYQCASRTICSGSVCQCDPSLPLWRDCNGDQARSVGMGGNGCETNTAVPNQQHCGACGNDCGGDATCMGGPPACVCNDQQLDCAAGRPWCETPYSTNNCGDCGARCGPNEGCNSAGQCACGSNTGGMGAGRVCTGSNQRCCSGSCVDLTQTANCRSCGNNCRMNETCGSSDCQCDGGARCGGSDTCCPGPGPDCVETDTDINHCGGCGNNCPSDQADACSGGNCRCAGGAACGGGSGDNCCPGDGCRDLDNETNNCGACGTTCGSMETCSGGECQCDGASGGMSGGPRCGAGTTCCPSDGCVNTDNDRNNCGGCGITCGPMETCSGGQCRCMGQTGGMVGGPICGGATTCCPGAGCVNTANDRNNCGGCGTMCGNMETCSGSQCVCNGEPGGMSGGPLCTGADICCDGDGCVNTTNDRDNCGGCGITCGNMEICSGSQCVCNGEGGGTSGGPQCTGANTCCDGVGCVDLSTDRLNCGGCGIMCGPMETCSGGMCVCNGEPGGMAGGPLCTGSTTCCDGDGCVDTDTDAAHCGGCGNACTAAEGNGCSGGMCTCDGGAGCTGMADDTCCPGSGCVDTTGDASHCGGCGVACATGANCNTSMCVCAGGSNLCFDGVQGDACQGSNCECGGMPACDGTTQTCDVGMGMCVP